MTNRSLAGLRVVASLVGFASFCTSAVALPPEPLESAYWRFEEGQAFDKVPTNVDSVVDSINDNDMRAYESEDGFITSAPTYTSTVPPKPLKSGAANTLALDFFQGQSDGNKDIYTFGKNVDKGDTMGNGYTIEAAFFAYAPNTWGTILGKEGRPGAGSSDFYTDKLPTFALKTNADTSRLMVQQFDQAGNLVDIQSQIQIAAQQWYYAAVVNDESTLSLWIDSGNGYELQGSVAVDGAIYEGLNPDEMDWSRSWTVGRGQFADGPTDWFDGLIDEVRISNTALDPSDFLFAPPDDELSGDHNGDGTVDILDYVVWRADPGNFGNDDGYEAWSTNYGNTQPILTSAVPEPASVLLAGMVAAVLSLVRRRRAG